MSFTALRDVLGVPSTPISINSTSFVSYALPALLSYLVVAVLAVTPQTHSLRVMLWPIAALLALRAALSLELSLGKPEHMFNLELVLSMILIPTRTLEWTLAKEPLKRHIRPSNSTPSVIMDALDLATNFRGYGWDWSKGLHVPRETRPLTRTRFVACVMLSAGLHTFISGTLHRAVQSFSLDAFCTLHGSSIFDETLPFFIRYLRSSIISIFWAFHVYSALQMKYNLCIIPAVLILRQDPLQWPPAFDAPWFATSVNDFWGRRWQQPFRQTFIFVGGHPVSLAFGRVGGVFGAFFASAVFHHIFLAPLNGQAEFWRMLVPFGMMAVGALGERTFLRGVMGWVWTMTWLILWGNFLVDAWARGGLIGCSSIIDSVTPVRVSVERWVMAFDAWLHTF
ncbi:hypothetical protein BU15DRAFT_91051 [Melanogaster broomeanus]|nr:hypothetical protein BU15DRAFT_91051 [Melanogaster broomeanus]